ncbi:MAG: ABC transporter ATP-binding protein [Bradymonadaceae bacterium]
MQRVELDNLTKAFGRDFALHRLSIGFEAGDITGLAGDNGSGKTTLLNVLATLSPPTRGEVHYDDLDWSTFAGHYRNRIGWVSHESLVYGELTGRENLSFYARMYGGDGDDGSVEPWLERVGLADDADKRVADYSRGMRQRLSIARALLHDPDLLLFDEPLTGLDRSGRETVLELIRRQREAGKIGVVASHDLGALGELCDRVAILDRGALGSMVEPDSESDLAEAYVDCG